MALVYYLVAVCFITNAVDCDFTCVCNYNVEKGVFADKSTAGDPIGYMYEFDCKPSAGGQTNGHWLAVAFENKLGYVESDAQVEVQTCPGDPDPSDLLTTTPGHTPHHTTTTQTTTPVPTTTTTTPMPTTTTTTPRPTTTTTTPVPTTTTTTPVPTTTTTTPKPTTTTTTPTPTTTTTTPTPVITTTTTPKPVTTTTQGQTTTATTVSMPYITGVTYGCDPKYVQMANNEHGTLFTYGHHCFEIVPTEHSWTYAENECQKRGGHLAHIEDLAEHNAIYEVVRNYHGDHVWIGLNDRNHEEHFQWSSGDPVNYTNFYSGRKDLLFHGLEDCVAMWLSHSGGKWEDVRCSHTYGYVCEFSEVPINITSPGVTTENINSNGDIHLCPAKARNLAMQYGTLLVQHGGSCYELLHNRVIYSHAESLCRDGGGHLVHINDASEQAWIDAFIQRQSPTHAIWIGLNDINSEGHFEWTDGHTSTYTNWIPGHENNLVSHTVADCVALFPYKGGVWDDVPCGQDSFFGETGELHLGFCEYATGTTALHNGAVLVG